MTAASLFTRASFLAAPKEVFSRWYQSPAVQAELAEVKRELKAELDGFADQTGLHKLVLTEVRVKDHLSFLTKIRKYQEKPEKKFAKLAEPFDVRELVTDLIGARLVFFYEEDLDFPLKYFGTSAQYDLLEAELYDNFPEGSPFARSHLEKYLRWMKIRHSRAPKPTAYEGVHLLVRFNPTYLLTRRKSKQVAATTNGQYDHFRYYPVEVQIRTLLQHCWSHCDHAIQYSILKAGHSPERQAADSVLKEMLILHNRILATADHQQNIILERYKGLGLEAKGVSGGDVP